MTRATFKLAKALRFLFDLWLGGGIALLAFYAFRIVWLLVSPATVFPGPGKGGGGAVWVGVGIPVAMDPGDSGVILSPELFRTTGELRFQTSDGRIQALSYLDNLILTLLIVGLLYLTRQFLVDVMDGTPYTSENARRLKWAGWLMLGIGVAKPLTEILAARWTLSMLRIQSPTLSPAFDVNFFIWGWILVALFVLILSAVFRHGVELEKESSLTV